MQTIKWTDEFSVNIVSIDNQHKVLVGLLNEVTAAIEKEIDPEFTEKILSSLKDYVDYHFKTEEYYFELFDYPDKDQHISEHNIFRNKITEFNENFSNSHENNLIDIFNFLKKWIFIHIEKSDKSYSDFFIARGLG